ncbi:MAG: PHP domain-containing protein [bacterium]|nr:PHP domain-containing protein [bacterium]
MIDLHIHTNYSDGSASVIEVLKQANLLCLDTISITDHNTVDSYYELKHLDIKKYYQGNIIKGVELYTHYNKEIIEILCYDFDLDKMNKLLKEIYPPIKKRNIYEYNLIADKFNKLGIRYNINNIKEKFTPDKASSRYLFYQELIKYEENKKHFLYPELINQYFGFARREFFNASSPLYIDITSLYPSLEELLLLTKEANALCFIAHIYSYTDNIINNLDDIITNYKIDGIECYYSKFTAEQTTFLLDYCQKHNLLVTGGSDYHGTSRANVNIGIGQNNLNIPASILDSWPKKTNV